MNRARIKRAELAAGLGAGIVGVGLGALFAARLAGYASLILAIGLLMHGWGMFDKHRMERADEGRAVWWGELFYWICWGLLLVLAALVLAGCIS